MNTKTLDQIYKEMDQILAKKEYHGTLRHDEIYFIIEALGMIPKTHMNCLMANQIEKTLVEDFIESS